MKQFATLPSFKFQVEVRNFPNVNSRGQQRLLSEQTYTHLKLTLEPVVLPCCYNHPWPVGGAARPLLLTVDGRKSVLSLSHFGSNVNVVWRCFWEVCPGFKGKGNSVRTA